MSQIKFRHGRKFPPRVSREELYNRTNQKVEECGVNNHFQAVFTNKIAQEVVGLKEYKYESLQPELKLKENPAWKYAFTVAKQYLADFQMNETLNTMSIELQKNKLPTDETILKKTNSVLYLGKLVDLSNNLPSFEECVDQFAEKEKLPEGNSNPSSASQKAAQKYTQKEKDKLFDIKPKKSLDSPQSSPKASTKQQPQAKAEILNDDDFEDVQINDSDNLNASHTDPSPPQSPSKEENKVEEKLSDQFEDSFGEEADLTNGKPITQATFSKTDFSVAVDQLQSDDGKQTEENKQLLQELMTDNEPEPEVKKQENTNKTQTKVAEDFSDDIDVDIPLDSNSSIGIESNQQDNSSPVKKDNPNDTKDINAEFDDNEDDFELEGNDKNDSPIKSKNENQPSNTQASPENEVEEFNSDDDFDIDIDGDFDQDSEKEKKENSPTKPANAPSPKEDFDNDLAEDVDLENLPSANNSPQKTPESPKNSSIVESEGDFDVEIESDFDNVEENNSSKAPSNNTSNIKDDSQKAQPEPHADENSDNFNDDFEDIGDDVEDIEVEDDVQSENNESNSINSKSTGDTQKQNESDNFDVDVDFDSADFDVDDS